MSGPESLKKLTLALTGADCGCCCWSMVAVERCSLDMVATDKETVMVYSTTILGSALQ